MASFYGGGHGRGTWFPSPGAAADHCHQGMATSFPWGRGGSGSGERAPTLAQVMASCAPEPWTIRWDALRAAEETALEVAVRVHPTQEAERRRQDIVSYLKRLLGSTFGFEGLDIGKGPVAVKSEAEVVVKSEGSSMSAGESNTTF